LLRVLGNDDVAEHEVVGDLRDSREQIALSVSIEVVDRENRDDKIERAGWQRVLEAREAEVGVG
jgi:hypothetical protein